MKFIKSLFVLFALVLSSQAATYTLILTNGGGFSGVVTTTGSGNTLSITGGNFATNTLGGPLGPIRLRSINVVNNSASAQTLGFFDSGDGNIALAVSQGLALSYRTNITQIITNYNGALQTNTFSNVWFTDTTQNQPFSIAKTKIGSAAAVSSGGGTATVSFSPALICNSGFAVTNSLANTTTTITTVTLDYDPLLP